MDKNKQKQDKNFNYNYSNYEAEVKNMRRKNDNIFYFGSTLTLLLGILIYYLIEKYYVSYKEIIPPSEIIRPLSDKRSYKLIKLHTGLEVLLIHDPETKISASALVADSGSIHDITSGMAHLCEYMLFSGSKKYPSPTEFKDNLKKFNGLYNSFTTKDKTLYYFEIKNNGFIEQFNIFSSHFDKPIFNKTYIDREVKKINLEHEKHKKNDEFVTDFIVKNEGNKESPFTKFECGNDETLINIKDKLRKELIFYFENFYTNDNMKLVVYSNYTIENLTKLVEDNFISGFVAKSPKLKCQNKLSAE